MIPHGSTCTQYCYRGYQPTSQGVCYDGNYTPIQCIAIPPPPPPPTPPPPPPRYCTDFRDPVNGYTEEPCNRYQLQPNEYCRQKCNRGFKLKPGSADTGWCMDIPWKGHLEFLPIECEPDFQPQAWAPPPQAWAPPPHDPNNFQCYRDEVDTFNDPFIPNRTWKIQPQYCKNKTTLEIVDNSYCSMTDNGCEIPQACTGDGQPMEQIFKTGPGKRLEISSRYNAGCANIFSRVSTADDIAAAAANPWIPQATQWFGHIHQTW